MPSRPQPAPAGPIAAPSVLAIGDSAIVCESDLSHLDRPGEPVHLDDLDALIEALLRTLHVPQQERMEARGEIARGGVGLVSVSFDRLLQRRIAVKSLLDEMRRQPLIVRSFIREAQITGQLDHPNIVPVHDIGIDEDGRIYFTMKLVEGRTLGELLDQHADEHRHVDMVYDQLLNLLEIVIKVCDALAFAHSRGVIHCDIKANNIMVGDFGEVYLMDWGFAQLVPPRPDAPPSAFRVEDPLPRLPDHMTQGFVLGTPGSMSPEQARGEIDRLDERSDIFSLGALLYQILAGEPPFHGQSQAETVLLAQRCQFPPLREESVGYSVRPKELVRIVQRAMAADPADRYPSVEAMKADLVRFVRGGSNFPSRRFEAGAHIIREGETADDAYIITAGQCEVYKMVGHKRVSLQILEKGAVFGEMALLAASPRSASVVALTAVTAVVVTREVVDKEMNSMKPWMGAFIRTLASRFRELQESRLSGADRMAPAPDALDAAEPARPWWKIW